MARWQKPTRADQGGGGMAKGRAHDLQMGGAARGSRWRDDRGPVSGRERVDSALPESECIPDFRKMNPNVFRISEHTRSPRTRRTCFSPDDGTGSKNGDRSERIRTLQVDCSLWPPAES